MERTGAAMQPVVMVKKLSYEELRKHGYTLKVCSNISKTHLGLNEYRKENTDKEPQKTLLENEVPHFPSWAEGSIVWGRVLNSPWWPALVCAPDDGLGRHIPGCAWLRWACGSGFDVVCNVNIIEFKEGYLTCFTGFNKKGYKRAVLANIKAIAKKSDVDVTKWSRHKLMKWASNGFKPPTKDLPSERPHTSVNKAVTRSDAAAELDRLTRSKKLASPEQSFTDC